MSGMTAMVNGKSPARLQASSSVLECLTVVEGISDELAEQIQSEWRALGRHGALELSEWPEEVEDPAVAQPLTCDHGELAVASGGVCERLT
jgi:hypothetical protein